MVMKEGYKQTEVGVIPMDWEVKEFVDVIDGFSSGQTPYRAITDYYKGDIPWITSGELNYNVITDTIEKITIEGVKAANLKILPIGTFLFAITGLEAAGTRGSCGITGIKATTNQSCMALYPKKGVLTTPYLYHYYVRYGDELAFKYCQGTKQQSYTGAIAKKLPIIVPPSIKEQTAIATALSDADALITSLEKLISKKRNIKQGAMQQLLQPKEGWEVKKLGDVIINFQNGYGFSAIGYVKSGIPIITMAQIGLNGSFNFDETKVNFWKPEDFSVLKNFHIKNGDLIIAMTDVTPEKNLIGRMAIVKTNQTLLLNQRVGLLRLDNTKVNAYFLKTLSNMRSWRTYCIGSASLGVQANIGTKDILNGELSLPNINEQNKIAEILYDMDTEITALEQKLEKYKKVKLGMMQELLTGKTRLV
ncbi:restriction endonuclease subunit S [Flavobacterium sp. RSSB_23]|uniref:restriction endonuclease subunit S n=1 Tax=Flavobacterium sp. RSSB_23 TaxID=3447668 RepID=UPI003F3B1A6F